MATKKRSSKHLFKNQTLLFIGLAILVIAGGIFYFMRSRTTQTRSRVAVALSVPASSNDAMFGFDLQRTHFNRSEHIINTTNVSQLVPYWLATTSDYINSSPAVSAGIVYIGSNDKAFYAINAKTGSI